jgi:8-oxo-dGTP pyrophosphatase MutT (NUDIX family)
MEGSVVRVVAAVVEEEGHFLVGRRPGHKRHGGMWEFPGGKVRDGESDLEAVRRELAEELSLAVVGVGRTLARVRDPGSPFLVEFVEARVRGEARPLEHDEVRWAGREELLRLPLAPSDARFVREGLGEDASS